MAKGSSQPVMAVLDTLGRRWALRVLWELQGEALTFRGLREACGQISPTVLNTRLGEMRELGVVSGGPDGYQLTDSGKKLGRLLLGLDRWARDNARAPRERARPAGGS